MSNRMTIFKKEIFKLFDSASLWFLLIISLLLNFFLVWHNVGEEFHRNRAASMYEAMDETDFNSSNIYETTKRLSPDSIIEEPDETNFWSLEAWRERDRAIRSKEDAIGYYYGFSGEYENFYDELDMTIVEEEKLQEIGYQVSDSYKKFLDNQYLDLQRRVKEIRESEDGNDIFYLGNYINFHSKLYIKILRIAVLEMLLIMMVSVSYLMDYERNNRTSDVIISSRFGRKIAYIKAAAGTCVGFLFSAVIMACTLLVFFSIIPMKGLWNTSVSSIFIAEDRELFYPFITWKDMTVAGYLVTTVALIMLFVVIVGIFSASVWLFMKNGWYTFTVILGTVAILYFIPQIYRIKNFFSTIFLLNPVKLWSRIGRWFMEDELPLCFRGNEAVSIALFAVTSAILLVLSVVSYWKSSLDT